MEVRGYRFDARNGRIPTMRTLRFIVDLLARYRYNRFDFLFNVPVGSLEDDDGWEVSDFPSESDLAKLAAYAEFQGISLVINREVGPDAIENSEGSYDFANEAALLSRQEKTFVICPGTSANKSLAGRVENMRQNLENAERAVRSCSAKGMVLTDGGEGAGWEPLIASLPGIVLAGLFSTAGAKAAHMDLEKELNTVLDAPLGGYILKLGTLYLRGGAVREGSSELYNILANPIGYSRHPGLTDLILDEISGIAAGVRIAAERWIDRSPWAKEIVYSANLIDCACHRRDEARLRAVRDEHGRVWRTRFREVGRIESMMKLPRF